MKIEIIIHYTKENTEQQLLDTMKSMLDLDCVVDVVRLCINPPVNKVPNYSEFINLVRDCWKSEAECFLQILTYTRDKIEDVINDAVQISNADHYIFVNAGYVFNDNDIIKEIRKGSVIFSEGVDNKFNEFSCSVKLHKHLGGFGDHYSLIEKIEYKLKALEEARNGTATKLTEGRSDNL